MITTILFMFIVYMITCIILYKTNFRTDNRILPIYFISLLPTVIFGLLFVFMFKNNNMFSKVVEVKEYVVYFDDISIYENNKNKTTVYIKSGVKMYELSKDIEIIKSDINKIVYVFETKQSKILPFDKMEIEKTTKIYYNE